MKHKREQKNLKIRTEDNLLLLCARTHIDNEIKTQIKSIIQQKIDWDYLLNKASQHRLRPLLYWQLNNVCPDSIPKNVMELLKTFFHENAHKNLLFIGELLRILKLLKSQGITAIPYKGPMLAIQVYGNLGFRQFDDLDIFIKKSDVIIIKDLLINEGYKTDFYLNELQEENYLKSQKNLVLLNAKLDFYIELHWKISGNFFSFSSTPEYLLSDNPKSIQFNNHDILTFSPENQLIILCIHAAGHHWSRLLWLCDIAELIKNFNLNWTIIIDKIKQLNIKRIFDINLILANEILGVEIPKQISRNINNDISTIKLLNGIKENIFSENQNSPALYRWINFHLKIRENLNNGLIDLIKYATIPSIKELEKLKLPDTRLYPIYFVFRPINLINKFRIN